MMNNRDALLQERLAQLAAGVPLDHLLDGLSADEAESLKLVAVMGTVTFEQNEAAVSAKRTLVIEAARAQLAGADSVSAVSSGWVRLRTWLAQRPAYRGAALGISALVILALLGTLWLNRGRPEGVALDSAPETGGAAPQLTQSISQEKNSPDAGRVEGDDSAEETVASAAVIEGEGEQLAASAPAHQIYVPLIGNTLQETADQAVISRPRGLVEMATVDGNWLPIDGPTSIRAGHFIRTGSLSSAILTFYDGSRAQIGPDSQLYIDQLNALRPQDGFRTVVLTQQFGETTHSVQFRNDAASLYQVKTPTGSGIARGTQFRVRVSDDAQASYTVTEGKVNVRNANHTVSVLAGQQTSFTANKAPLAPKFWVEGNGFVSQTGDDAWIIAGQSFSITAETRFEGSPGADDFVHVEGHLDGDGFPIADYIQLLWTSPQDTFTLTGEVGSQSDTLWQVAGQDILITPETDWDPEIVVGNLVRVSGTIQQPGGDLNAQKIELLKSIDEMPFEFVGIVESITAPWEVSGIELALADDAEVDVGIKLGDIVRVEGIILLDGTWLADEIKLLEEQEASFEFIGEVDTAAPTWSVAGISFEVDSFTVVGDGITSGDIVRVSGVILNDGTWLARSIERLDETLLEIIFVGIVDSNATEPWSISGLPIFTADAAIDPGIEAGSLVRVTALIQADSTWLATNIELLGSEPPVGCVTITAIITRINAERIILSNGQTVILDAGIIVNGVLSHNSVVAIVACANDDGTIEIVSITVVYDPLELPPPDDDDDNDDSDGGNQEARGSVCHKPGSPAEKTMSLPQSAIPAHLGHGDSPGACD